MPKNEKTYNLDFVQKIRGNRKQAEEGKLTTIRIKNLWNDDALDAAIKRGLKQSDNREVRRHEEVWGEIRERYGM